MSDECPKCDFQMAIEMQPGEDGLGVEIPFCPMCTIRRLDGEVLRAQSSRDNWEGAYNLVEKEKADLEARLVAEVEHIDILSSQLEDAGKQIEEYKDIEIGLTNAVKDRDARIAKLTERLEQLGDFPDD